MEEKIKIVLDKLFGMFLRMFHNILNKRTIEYIFP